MIRGSRQEKKRRQLCCDAVSVLSIRKETAAFPRLRVIAGFAGIFATFGICQGTRQNAGFAGISWIFGLAPHWHDFRPARRAYPARKPAPRLTHGPSSRFAAILPTGLRALCHHCH